MNDEDITIYQLILKATALDAVIYSMNFPN